MHKARLVLFVNRGFFFFISYFFLLFVLLTSDVLILVLVMAAVRCLSCVVSFGDGVDICGLEV